MWKRGLAIVVLAAAVTRAAPQPTLDDLLTCMAYNSFLDVARTHPGNEVKTPESVAKRRGYRIQEYACAVSEKKPFKWWNAQSAEAMVRLREEAGDWSKFAEMQAKYDEKCVPAAELADQYLAGNKGAGCNFPMSEMMEGLESALEFGKKTQ